MNIIFKRVDDSVEVVHLTQDAIEKMELARSYEPLVPQKQQLLDELAALDADLAALDIREKELLAVVLPGEPQVPPTDSGDEVVAAFLDALAEYRAIVAAGRAEWDAVALRKDEIRQQKAPRMDTVAKISVYEDVQQNIGLTLAEHAAVLQRQVVQPDGSTSYNIDPAHEPVAFGVTLPADRVFREAWSWTTPDPVIDLDMAKAKDVSHLRRRTARAKEFAPLDIEATIPSRAAAAEAARQAIRDRYALIQDQIDAAPDESVLRTIFGVIGS